MDNRNNNETIQNLLQENEAFAKHLRHFLERYVKFSDAFNYVREWFDCGDNGVNFTMKLLRRYRAALMGTGHDLTLFQKGCLVAMHSFVGANDGSSVDGSIAGMGGSSFSSLDGSSSSGEAGASGYDGDLG